MTHRGGIIAKAILTTSNDAPQWGVPMEVERTFRDNNGIEWRVTQAAPDNPSEPVSGWLVFESAWMDRRLSPYPQNWTTVTSNRLEQMCRIATPVEHQSSPARVEPESDSPIVARLQPGDAAKPETLNIHADADASSPVDHVSRLVDKWPAREERVTFRG